MALKKAAPTAAKKTAAPKLEAAAKAPVTPAAAPADVAIPNSSGAGDVIDQDVARNESNSDLNAKFDANGIPIADHLGEPVIGDAGHTDQMGAIAEAEGRAHADGYRQGYADALTDLAGKGDSVAAYSAGGSGDDVMVAVLGLVLMTPENHRKGGMGLVAGRLVDYLDELAPKDRRIALQYMGVIAQNRPMDLVSGRFKLSVNEALDTLNGVDRSSATQLDPSSTSSDAAAARLASLMPAEGSDPTAPHSGSGAAGYGGVDLSDPESSNAAAARLASL